VDVDWELPASSGGRIPNGDVYRAIREDLTGLLGRDPSAVQDLPVPACPEWRVRDVAAHLAGVVADVLAGRLDGVATDPWTAAQVDARRHLDLAQILDEWTAIAPQFETAASALGARLDARALIDTWTHQQDLRAALGEPPSPDPLGCRHTAISLLRSIEQRMDDGLLPSFGIVLDGTVCGDRSDTALVRTTAFEWSRALLGRRSRAQVLRWPWDGISPAPFVDELVVFDWAPEDGNG
jgi:uncharacterized protein (TIGR03083 family)